eukprot:8648038-Karenia_brevis.AAC.1
MNVDKRMAEVAQDMKPSLIEAVTSCDRVAAIKTVVEEATAKFGKFLQQSVLRQCTKIEER